MQVLHHDNTPAKESFSTFRNHSAPPSISQTSESRKQVNISIMMPAPQNQRAIVFFHPLIVKLVLNTDQYSYMYELQPGNEEEVSVIEQIAKIA